MILLILLLTSCKKDNDIPETVTDIDGNIYKTVTIGNQVWMGENLKTTTFNDGTPIPLVTDSTAWDGRTAPAYCWYNNNEALYKDIYGALYIYYTVSTGKLCPEGWHVATDNDWHSLALYLDNNAVLAANESVVAGSKLKEKGDAYWIGQGTEVTNETNFTALPGGYRTIHGQFALKNEMGWWWSSTDYAYDAIAAWTRALDLSSIIYREADIKTGGMSVRCIMD
jgi:uncharacterized protein (TIGR02145 family)